MFWWQAQQRKTNSGHKTFSQVQQVAPNPLQRNMASKSNNIVQGCKANTRFQKHTIAKHSHSQKVTAKSNELRAREWNILPDTFWSHRTLEERTRIFFEERTRHKCPSTEGKELAFCIGLTQQSMKTFLQEGACQFYTCGLVWENVWSSKVWLVMGGTLTE